MPQEQYRIEVDVIAQDHTNPGMERAQQRITRFEKAMARTTQNLSQLAGGSRQAKGHMDHLSNSTERAGQAAGRTQGRVANLAGAITTLGHKAHGAASGMTHLGYSANSAHGGLWQTYKMMLQMSIVMGMLTASTLPFVGSIKSLQLAGEMDRARRSIEFYSGAVEQGRKNFEDLVNFAVKSPIYEVPFVTKTAGQLLATGKGIGFAKRSLQAFGNAAMYTGASLSQLELAFYGFKQISAVGTLSMEELKQVTENLNVPLAWIAEELGVSQKELKDIGKMGIPAQKAMEAIIRTLEKRFPLKDFNSDLLALTSNVKESGRVLLWSFGEGMMGPVVRILQDLANELDPTSKGFKDFAAQLKSAGQTVGEDLERLYKKIKDFLKQFDQGELAKMGFGDKLIYGIEHGLDQVSTWLAGPGGKKVQDLFIQVAQIGGEAWLRALGGMVEGSAKALAEGNVLGSAGLLGGAALLGGGALVGGAIRGAKWLWNVGKSLFGKGGSAAAGGGSSAAIKAAAEAAERIPIYGANGQIISSVSKVAPEVATAGVASGGVGRGALRGAGRVVIPAALAYDAYNIYSAAPGKEKGKAIGGAVGGWGGFAGGALAGGAAGSAFPGVGNAVGAIIGGILGAVGGSVGGEYAGAHIFGGPSKKETVANAVRSSSLGNLGFNKPIYSAIPLQVQKQQPIVQVTIQSQPKYEIKAAADASQVMGIIRQHQTSIADQLADEIGLALSYSFKNMPVVPAG